MWNCKETGKQVHSDLLAQAHLCPRRSSEFQQKRKMRFCRGLKKKKRRKKNLGKAKLAVTWDLEEKKKRKKMKSCVRELSKESKEGTFFT